MNPANVLPATRVLAKDIGLKLEALLDGLVLTPAQGDLDIVLANERAGAPAAGLDTRMAAALEGEAHLLRAGHVAMLRPALLFARMLSAVHQSGAVL